MITSLEQQSNRPISIRGPVDLSGQVMVQGAKNSALKILPAMAALPAVFEVRRIPLLLDTLAILEILEYLGARVDIDSQTGVTVVDTREIKNRIIPYEMTRTTTAAFYFAGALLGRFGEAYVGKPGGDAIGSRPVNFHVEGWRSLGADVHEDRNSVRATLPKPPQHAVVQFPSPSAGAAVNVALATAGSHGSAVLDSVPKDADSLAFSDFLSAAGVSVGWRGDALELDASCQRQPGPALVRFECPFDRNDAFTWLSLGALSPRGILVVGVNIDDLSLGIGALSNLGANIEILESDCVRVSRPADGLVIPSGYQIVASGSPGFHSDWLPFLQMCLAMASGIGTTIDSLHSHRIAQVMILQKMGVSAVVRGGDIPLPDLRLAFDTKTTDAAYIVLIRGAMGRPLRPVHLRLNEDVRSAAVAVLAATQCSGMSILTAPALYRGYERFLERLRALGGCIDFGSK